MNKTVRFKSNAAHNPQKILRRCTRLLPALTRRGATPAQALAAAYNATCLFYAMKRPLFFFSPAQILSRYSLSEIARLCAEFSDNLAPDREDCV